MAKKPQVHREWFRSVALKKCECGERHVQVWTWGQYVIGKWRNVMHFCEKCFDDRVKRPLNEHTGECGCTVEMVGYHGEKLPAWLNTNVPCEV